MANKSSFRKQLSSWSNQVAGHDLEDWTEQLLILNKVVDLITPQLSLEEIIAAIYDSVNHLFDAYQFAVGIYDDTEGVIMYKGTIEDGKRLPDIVVNAIDEYRLASWCIRNEEDIFMNDVDKEITRYISRKPIPIVGSDPKAVLYTPLKLNDKVVGLIVVRTIHKNVYKQHHLYILKTVGNFVVRALEMGKLSSKPFMRTEGTQKQWRWCNPEQLPVKSTKILAFLTEREKEVLFLLVSGLPNKSIAEKLFVSAGTIKTHTLNIYHKLGVANRTSAIMKAVELGWFV